MEIHELRANTYMLIQQLKTEIKEAEVKREEIEFDLHIKNVYLDTLRKMWDSGFESYRKEKKDE